MHRFYCPDLSQVIQSTTPALTVDASPIPPAARTIHLDRDESHHARRVLRMELGECVALFDGQGCIGRGTLITWTDAAAGPGHGALVRVDEVHHVEPHCPLIDLAVAIPKGPRADDMVASLSQLGVHKLIPLKAERAVVDPRPGKLERFNRAAVESAKQCGRAYLMSVEPQATLAQVLALGHDQRLIAAPGSPTAPATLEMPARLRSAKRVLILIGPEGGWTSDELAVAAASGCIAWTLGPHILRIETAAAAAAAIARYLADSSVL